MSRRDLRFTADSRRDLRSIVRYIENRWGERRRDKVAEQIRESLQRLAEFPDLGRARPEIGSELRSLSLQDYVIYYRVADADILILRIMHSKRDIGDLHW